MTHPKTSLALAAALMLAADYSAAAAGNFLLVSGDVRVVNAQGAARQPVAGGTIDTGETVVTQNGRAQIRFTDSGQVSLQPGTEFKLADYRFREAGSNAESALFSLFKGSIRAITGIVGRRTRSDYLVSTPTATIGIRGTEFQATVCAASCKEPDGLYVQTGQGVITVRNAAGEIDVSRGETAFVASPDTGPQKTSAAPALNAVAAAGTPAGVAISGAGEFRSGAILTTNTLGPITPFTNAGLALAAAGSITADGVTYSDVLDAGAGAGVGLPAGVFAGTYIDNGQVRGFLVSNQGSFASITVDTVRNAGSNGDLYWGRWSAGTLTISAGLNGETASASQAIPATASLHYLLGTTVPTVPTAGSASFSFIGGTPSTDLSGALGAGITSGTVTANFATNSVNANFVVAHGSNMNVSAVMPLQGSNRAAFSSSNPGGYVNLGPSSSVSGFFVGSGAPNGAGLSYSLNGNVVGVGAFR